MLYYLSLQNGKTTLICAAGKGDLLCVEELLKNGADVNMTDEVSVNVYMYLLTCLKRAQ